MQMNNTRQLQQSLFVDGEKQGYSTPSNSACDRCCSWGDWDVPLGGRSQETRSHIGYARFQSMVEEKKRDYLTARRTDKTFIADGIYSTIKSNGGRFLRKEWWKDGQKHWFELAQDKAMTKIIQALRESSQRMSSKISPGTQQATGNSGKQLQGSSPVGKSSHCAERHFQIQSQYCIHVSQSSLESLQSDHDGRKTVTSTESDEMHRSKTPPEYQCQVPDYSSQEQTLLTSTKHLNTFFFGDTSQLTWDPNVEELVFEEPVSVIRTQGGDRY
ncbi:hypothetical protein ACA910_020135 [Epithemia clementina (nom. ined.)]